MTLPDQRPPLRFTSSAKLTKWMCFLLRYCRSYRALLSSVDCAPLRALLSFMVPCLLACKLGWSRREGSFQPTFQLCNEYSQLSSFPACKILNQIHTTSSAIQSPRYMFSKVPFLFVDCEITGSFSFPAVMSILKVSSAVVFHFAIPMNRNVPNMSPFITRYQMHHQSGHTYLIWEFNILLYSCTRYW